MFSTFSERSHRSRGRNLIATGMVSGEPVGQNSQRVIPGHRSARVYGPEFVGVNTRVSRSSINEVTRDAAGRETSRKLVGKTTSPGGDDYVIIGNANPNYSIASTVFQLRPHFDASFLINTTGNRRVNNTRLVYATKGNAKRGKILSPQRWRYGVGIDEPQIYSSR